MKLRYKLLVLYIIFSAAFIFFKLKPKTNNSSGLSVLPKGDVEQIHINPARHTIRIQTATEIKTLTLPDQQSTIDVNKNGSVSITSKQFGLEHHFYAGAVLSDTGRFAVGADLLYYKRCDLGLGLADQFGQHTPIVFVSATYNVYGNINVGMMYGTNRYVGGIVSVRLF